MSQNELFKIVGIKEPEKSISKPCKAKKSFPVLSVVILSVLCLLCLFAGLISTKDPSHLDLLNYNKAPNSEFLFGTDTLGRDIFSCIWYGGRISIFIGFLATAISTFIAIVYGCISGMAPKWLDSILMRLTEILLSIPELLLIIFIQAILGPANVLSISLVIGLTSWCGISKVVRTEVRQLREAEYVMASRSMGGGFFHLMRCHLAPNFVSSIMFMVVMNIRGAIVAESTLSFMGMGLPLDIISWGSMLSLAEKALMTKSWWIVLIPGAFLVCLLMCVTNIGNYLRKSVNRSESYL